MIYPSFRPASLTRRFWPLMVGLAAWCSFSGPAQAGPISFVNMFRSDSNTQSIVDPENWATG
jgi:hypothetical protein